MRANKRTSRRGRSGRWMAALVLAGGLGALAAHVHAVGKVASAARPVFMTAEAAVPAGTQTSANWGGYIDLPAGSQLYTSVTGSWTVPTITGRNGAMAAQWIGLGGVETQDLLQIGTLEQVVNGQTQVQVFWEKLPAAANTVMTVPVGSKISASIQQSSASTWTLSLQAITPSGQTLSKTVSVNVSSTYAANIGTSAEWISEDPSTVRGGLYPLANSGVVQFSNATVNGQPLDATGNQVQPVAMQDEYGNWVIVPSAVGSDGESFSTTTYTAAPSWPGSSAGWTSSTGSSGGSSGAWPGISGFPFPSGQGSGQGASSGWSNHTWSYTLPIPGGGSGWTEVVGWPGTRHWTFNIPLGGGSTVEVQFSWGW
ncbi:G1 family glutamic endopeptidase [Alicyclobacillus vulcanalis]|uniref:Peptidase A4 family protein n=1 Tax=Alicyclobacillus vulcanalis TaxID=252246 RepID=A0A1N7PTK5_9BACL|nr:G1 family glutamic endopeptidase [Alicyclobacillus vulcanalis]SIT13983.1 Peptidase A4 family protein [Alicyclobacillus vulcanalis]